MTAVHAPLQGPPPLQPRGDAGTRRSTRGAQRPVGENDGGGVGAEYEENAKVSSQSGSNFFSAAVPTLHRGKDPATFSGFQATHFYR